MAKKNFFVWFFGWATIVHSNLSTLALFCNQCISMFTTIELLFMNTFHYVALVEERQLPHILIPGAMPMSSLSNLHCFMWKNSLFGLVFFTITFTGVNWIRKRAVGRGGRSPISSNPFFWSLLICLTLPSSIWAQGKCNGICKGFNPTQPRVPSSCETLAFGPSPFWALGICYGNLKKKLELVYYEVTIWLQPNTTKGILRQILRNHFSLQTNSC